MFEEYKKLNKTKKMIEDSKLHEELLHNSVQCKCTNRIPFRVFKRYQDYAICKWCGAKVYKTPELEARYNFKKRLNEALKKPLNIIQTSENEYEIKEIN